jgi:asparagine synthase (glutamine-hydrolysing)
MCGIVGFAGVHDDLLIRLMNGSQHHRGPDEGGYYCDQRDAVSLAMRRLSIIDVSEGHQPMAGDDEQIWIVFNGEIVNAPELRTQLEADGYRFKTGHSDTEVLIHLYAKYQENMLSHLNGMFAFVLHDRKRRRLFGARDHFGIKPLYYSFDGALFAFASELKSLASVPWLGREINRQALYHYLSFQCVPSPQSIYEDISKLEAGESFTLDLERMEFKLGRYWRPPSGQCEEGQGGLSPEQLATRIRTEFEGAVHRWRLSDVPIACSLSGGIDSAAIVGLMAEAASSPLRTYSLGFEDAPSLDERHLAKRVAMKWGTEHHEIVLKCDDLLNDLDEMIYSLDEPYAGGLPSWFVFKGMAGEVKVCMTGTGGDELFGNYGKWRGYESMTGGLRQVFSLVRRYPRWVADWFRFRKGSRYSIYFRECEKRSELLAPAWISGCESSEALIERLWKEGDPATVRDAARIIDLQIQLPDEFLHMTDRFSMAFSIEARPPFLDRQFAESMMSIPATTRIGSAHLKEHLIAAVRDVLPPELISAPKKGFVLPMGSWLRGRLKSRVQHLLGRDYLRRQGIFSENVYDRMVRPHLEGRVDASSKIWTLLMFQLWWNQRMEPIV